jgi:acetoin utilization protein AcuC
MAASTIGSINLLPNAEKTEIYTRLVPPELCTHFQLPPSLTDSQGNPLFNLKYTPGSTDVEMKLFHRFGFPDPILYGHLTDTLNGQIHVLLYILNDPEAPRFDVDRMPDGSATRFGTLRRNLEAEKAALEAGLAPGQVRRGLRLLPAAIVAFESFVKSLGHDIYFVEPLYYHNAVIFENYGFGYQVGKKLMEEIEAGFAEGGALHARLDDSTPFRPCAAEHSIRLRSWAIHDGVLGEPFTNVTMYKRVGKSANINTRPSCGW